MEKSKIYIFFTGGITGVGGTQIYINNKSRYLESRGWQIIIFTSFSKGSIVFDGLKKYKSFVYPELQHTVNYSSKNRRNRILASMKNEVNGFYEAIVVESHDFFRAEWGELLSKELKAKHIIYSLNEYNKIGSQEDFLKFKLNRRELAGITPNAISNLFSDLNLQKEFGHIFLPAACFSLNVPVEIETTLINNLPDADFNIAYFGRVNKKIMPKVVDEILLFSRLHPDKTLNFVILGYTSITKKAGLNNLSTINRLSNVNIHYWEVMDVIPKSFFRKMDVVIAVSGSARISALEKALTITIDVNDFQPIGILGITTNNSVYRETSESMKRSLSYWLTSILLNKSFSNEDISFDRLQEYKLEKETFERFIEESEKKSNYFNFNYRFRGFLIDDLKAMICRFFGIKFLKSIYSFVD